MHLELKRSHLIIIIITIIIIYTIISRGRGSNYVNNLDFSATLRCRNGIRNAAIAVKLLLFRPQNKSKRSLAKGKDRICVKKW